MAENDTETPDEEIARLKSQLAEARSEAAKQRVAKRTAVEDAKAQLKADLEAEFNGKLEAATKSQTEAVSEVGNSKLQIAKLKAALTTVFDEATTGRVLDIAGRLQGDSDEALGEDAKRLKSLYGLDAPSTKSPASDPTQGKGNVTPLNGDKLTNLLEQAFNKH